MTAKTTTTTTKKAKAKSRRCHTTKAAKAKARVLQNLVAEDIRSMYPVLDGTDVHPALMGESGIDIKLSNHARQFFGFAVECKNTEILNIWNALKQAEANGTKEKLTPLVVFKRNLSQPYVAMSWEVFKELIRPVC